ncbi:hypothetical protein [Zhihengliuella salsuginis]|uniref:Uncharacterized protein n=1 Tax=Zhihengliuella salsuginis TaxID=578222 RepID=A0ABQ3GM40_9MICC|nr:hypothetical protein [Zhihengliuella salsuginis]GHD13454.1 hypothetical protein GCM10008096_29660 [Zhihengliuella salsuginis]
MSQHIPDPAENQREQDRPTEPIGPLDAGQPTEPIRTERTGEEPVAGQEAHSAGAPDPVRPPEPVPGSGPEPGPAPAPASEPAPAPAPAPAEIPIKNSVPLGTLIFGLIVLVVGVLLLAHQYLDIVVNPAFVTVSILIGAGLIMVVGGISAARRNTSADRTNMKG